MYDGIDVISGLNSKDAFGKKIVFTKGNSMYKIDRKKCIAIVLCINVIGYSQAAPKLNENLDLNSAEALIEKAIRGLEQDLNGKGKYVPEEDMLLLSIMARKSLAKNTYQDLYSNKQKIDAQLRKTMRRFVAYRAEQHASARMNDEATIKNAVKIEKAEFRALLKNNPLRAGDKLYHYFGKTFETRMSGNIMNGKYKSYGQNYSAGGQNNFAGGQNNHIGRSHKI